MNEAVTTDMEVGNMRHDDLAHRKGFLVFAIALVLIAAVVVGGMCCYFLLRSARLGLLISLGMLPLVPLTAYALYIGTIFPYFRRLEDANLELHLKQEELLDTKDDLFVKFLGVYDVNYAANSPRLFSSRLKDVADIIARVMDADACFIYFFDKKKEELVLAATNGLQEAAIGSVRIPLGEGLEGWVGRRLEPLMVKEYHADSRARQVPGLDLADYASAYCLPLYVYSNGTLVGVMEVLYGKAKTFTDEEINFFTTLSGIISTTVQNEQMQVELRKMNIELEQWVAEKTEELRASEERYRALVENASEAIFVLAENGDVVFANEQAASLTGHAKYDLIHKNLFELFVPPVKPSEVLVEVMGGRRSVRETELKRTDGIPVPVEVIVTGLSLMGRRFVQTVVRDISSHMRLVKLLKEKELELSALKTRKDP